jgi:MoxR-like ATPase
VSDEIGPDGQTTLVGRARELEAIATAMATARRGAARVVHLVGEAGIGKTALAEQAAALAAGQGWTVVWGRAWGAEAAPPCWIWQ